MPACGLSKLHVAWELRLSCSPSTSSSSSWLRKAANSCSRRSWCFGSRNLFSTRSLALQQDVDGTSDILWKCE